MCVLYRTQPEDRRGRIDIGVHIGDVQGGEDAEGYASAARMQWVDDPTETEALSRNKESHFEATYGTYRTCTGERERSMRAAFTIPIYLLQQRLHSSLSYWIVAYA